MENIPLNITYWDGPKLGLLRLIMSERNMKLIIIIILYKKMQTFCLGMNIKCIQ